MTFQARALRRRAASRVLGGAVEALEHRLLLARLIGIDTSTYQPNVNWTTVHNPVAQGGGGKDFAIVRATAGLDTDDSQFLTNMNATTGPKAKGMYVGFYHFAYYDLDSTHTAIAEADHFFNVIKPYLVADGKTLMPVLDVERPNRAGWTNADLNTWVFDWCSRVRTRALNENGVNVTPMIYTGASRASTQVNAGESQDWPLWVAQWPSTLPNTQTAEPSGKGNWAEWAFWQYAGDTTGTCPGVGNGTTTPCDLDVFNGDAEKIKDYVVGSVGRWADNTWIKVNKTGGTKAWNDPTSNANSPYSDTNVTVANGTIGKVLQGPVFGNGGMNWQILYNNGVTGWSAERELDIAVPTAPTNPSPVTNYAANTLPTTFTWTASSQATSYDVYRDGVFKANVAGTSWTRDSIPEGLHTWQVVARNGVATNASAVWNVSVDNVAPTASYGGQTPSTNTPTMDFTVTYADASSMLDATSFNTGDVNVTSGGGFSATATYISTNVAGNGTPRTVTYRINAPGGTWDLADAGVYTISQVASQVKDIANNFRAAGAIGSFNYNVSDSPAPGMPLLRAETDSGASQSDNRTNFNNSNAARALKFDVPNTIAGATVNIYINGTLRGSAVASGTTTLVTTDGTSGYSFGTYSVTAKQTDVNKPISGASGTLSIIIDVGGPATPTVIDVTNVSTSSVATDWNSSSAPDLWGYNIYRSLTSGGTYTKLNGPALPSSDYVDNSVNAGTTYYYVATGIDTAGNETNFSPEVVASTPQLQSATPSTVDLNASSDSGALSSDNITNRNNSSGKTLSFDINGTVADATINIFADGVLIGSGVAAGANTNVVTDGIELLGDGTYAITATQTEVGKTESVPTAAWNLTVDTAAPVATVVPVSPDPRGSGVSSIGINFNEVVANFDRLDLTLKRDGGLDLLSASQNLTSGNDTNFTLDTLSSITNPTGIYVLTFTAAGSSITDIAGNAIIANASDAFAVRVITGTAGADALRLVGNGLNTFDVFINNNTATPDYSLTVAPGDDVRIDGTGANDTLDVTGSTINIANDMGNAMTVNAKTGASVNFNVSQHLKGLNLDSGLATLVAGGSKVIVTDTLTATSGGTLDLTDNDLIVKLTPASTISALVDSGFGNFDWLGTGITSSTAATFAQIDGSRAVGVIDNNDWGYGEFSGETVNGSDVLVKFTYTGDTNVDGLVDNDDFGQFLYGFNGGGAPKWINGDFDHNGVVDNDDFGWLLTGMDAFNASGGIQL